MPAAEVVKTLNSYGIAVNTGLILGFDGESDKAAEKMLAVVEGTGAFPTLVLPLHALPGTRLTERLEREGRLFKKGVIPIVDGDRTDTATTGLNFATARPRADILRDLVGVLEKLYQPRNHYARVALTTRQLRTARKFFPPARKLPQLLRAFGGLVRQIGLDRQAGPYFWKSLVRAAVTNPGALEMVLATTAMNSSYERQSRSYVEALRQQIAYVDRVGEAEVNRSMGAVAVQA
jgi:radical SAM superfamily enzyme YgiQ (UPF0313 family)